MPSTAATWQQRRGIGLPGGQVVAADHYRKIVVDAGRDEMRAHEPRRLVRYHRERNPHRAQPREPVEHAGEEAGLGTETRGVVGLVAVERILDTPSWTASAAHAGGERQRAPDEIRHALADQRADNRLRERRIAELGEQRIDRGGELVDCVEQRAVEIESDRAYVEERPGVDPAAAPRVIALLPPIRSVSRVIAPKRVRRASSRSSRDSRACRRSPIRRRTCRRRLSRPPRCCRS